ncbi:helix-turn-helix domain-containing protein [Vagococcus fluvialis]|uniref:helix-turn-helix domain-containing protein n=1 Tax=Vagococcus fluvialis TaxID=2738 RepID=UPI003B221214
MELKEIIAKNIQNTRTGFNKTQKEVATALGTSEQSYNRMESGKFFPSTENLYKIAEFFNVSTDFLLGRTTEPTEITAEAIHQYINSLSQSELQWLELEAKKRRLYLRDQEDKQQLQEEKRTVNSEIKMDLPEPE